MKRSEYCEYINRYKDHLYTVAYFILNNKMDAEDAAENAILKGYEHMDQLRNPHKFKTWMITITKNEALKIKKKRLELPGNEKMETMMEPVWDCYNELWDIVQKLNEEYRLVVVMYYYNGLSIRDISGILNIPVGTVKSRLNRGRELLKKSLS
ncbi:MAG: RNA polymerase sigma factor [Lachnospiraceae bacterium]